MCGRYSLTTSPDELFEEFGINPPADYVPRYNIAPQQQVPIIGRPNGEALEFATMQWGLVAWWSEDGSGGARSINARAETLLERPTFRDPFLYRRCWVLADGFYEWTGEDKSRQPWRFQRRDHRPFAFAGLWDRWTREDGSALFTCTIVTTDAGPIVRGIHDRMPVVLSRDARVRWLARDVHPDELSALLLPDNGTEFERFTVSPDLNRVTNDAPELILPHEAQGELF